MTLPIFELDSNLPLSWEILPGPLVFIDVETTGLAGFSRIVEIAVMRCEPGKNPKAFETLINPQTAIGSEEIHGICQADVEGAPTFQDIMPPHLLSILGSSE